MFLSILEYVSLDQKSIPKFAAIVIIVQEF